MLFRQTLQSRVESIAVVASKSSSLDFTAASRSLIDIAVALNALVFIKDGFREGTENLAAADFEIHHAAASPRSVLVVLVCCRCVFAVDRLWLVALRFGFWSSVNDSAFSRKVFQ